MIIIFYSAHIKILRSRFLSRNTKLKLRPVLTYGSEAWTMTMEEMNSLRIFERKIVRQRYEHVKKEERQRIRTKQREEDILQGKDTVMFIKSSD